MANFDTISKLGPGRLLGVGAILMVVLGVLSFLFTRVPQGNMSLLFSDLELTESSKVVSKIESLGIAYEVRGEGSQILVPSKDLARVRMNLAETGLPSGGSVGYELFDRTDSMSTTNFVQSIQHIRALEGELTRSIKSITGVMNARVHIVLGKRELFSRDKQDASASVVLKMKGTARLNTGQVQAIQHLIASAVPGLDASRISILDDQGTLLARGNGGDDVSLASSTNQEYRAALERKLVRNIEDLLERSVGAGKVRAEVSAELDFTQISENEEIYDPEGQVTRSTQSVSEDANSKESSGSGGIISSDSELPTKKTDVLSSKTGSEKTGTENRNNRTDEVTNYEISKTVRNTIKQPGEIKRLSVAVLVDGSYEKDKDGKETYKVRDPKEIDQLTKLVKSAVGFSDKRGDVLEVVTMQFAKPEESFEVAKPEPEIMGLPKSDFMRLVEAAVMGIVGILFLLLVVRPVINKLMTQAKNTPPMESAFLPTDIQQMKDLQGPSSQSAAEAAAISEAEQAAQEFEKTIQLQQVEGKVKASSLKKVGTIVERHPDEALSIVRNWMQQDRV